MFAYHTRNNYYGLMTWLLIDERIHIKKKKIKAPVWMHAALRGCFILVLHYAISFVIRKLQQIEIGYSVTKKDLIYFKISLTWRDLFINPKWLSLVIFYLDPFFSKNMREVTRFVSLLRGNFWYELEDENWFPKEVARLEEIVFI